ncbi:MAG: hypothetical protein RIA69_09595 [Cyclobacteriaceae bacterium]
MKKSFDQHIKSRLSSFTHSPDAHLKAAVLGQLVASPPWYSNTFKVIGLILLLLSLFKIEINNNVIQGTATINYPQPPELLSINIERSQKVSPDHYQKNGIQKYLKEDQVSAKHDKVNKAVETSDSYSREIDNSVFQKFNLTSTGNYLPLPIQIQKIEQTNLEQVSLEKIMILLKNEEVPIVAKNERRFFPYYNLGSYFLYNRIKPNLTDDIYVGEYESPFGLSSNRIGFLIEYGAERKLGKQLSLRTGLSFNNYNQQYSFSVRNTQPTQVNSSKVNDGFFEPTFEVDQVSISKRVSLAGLKSQLFWHAFPEETNVLFLSAEYQYLLGSGPTFKYRNEEYGLMKKNHFLLELGLKKLLFEMKDNGLFIMPSIRYGLYKFEQSSALSVRPFSVGLTLSLGLK